MEQEKFFKCPACREQISFLLDLSEDGQQTYIEDCEVCCRAIQVTYRVQNGQLKEFSAARGYT